MRTDQQFSATPKTESRRRQTLNEAAAFASSSMSSPAIAAASSSSAPFISLPNAAPQGYTGYRRNSTVPTVIDGWLIPSVAQESLFELPDRELLNVPEQCRFSAIEQLFFAQPAVVDTTSSLHSQTLLEGLASSTHLQTTLQSQQIGVGLQSLIFAALKSCDTEIRHVMEKNLILSGGSTTIPGFADRLRWEIRALYHQNDLDASEIAIASDSRRHQAVWIGSSIYASLVTKYRITEPEFQADRSILQRRTFF